MIYFDNAATSWPKPPEVERAVLDAVRSFGNPSRGAHSFSLAAARCVESTRLLTADLFGCPDPRRVAFTKNVTEALNIAVASIDGRILTTEAEHNSVLRPLYRRGDFDIVPVDALGRYSVADIDKHCHAGTKALVVAHASNLTGNVAPLEAMGEFCRSRGMLFVVDAAQTAGLLDIDMMRVGIDALCFTGHKSLYGLQGTGGICLSPRFTAQPLTVGGSGLLTYLKAQPQEMPEALEAGTLNSHGIASLAAGIRYVMTHRPDVLFKQADSLAKRFYHALASLPGLVFYGDYDAPLRAPIVSLNIGGLDAGDVAAELEDKYGIAVRAGAHCAPLLHERFGTATQGALRFSFSHFNTEAEVDVAVGAVKGICGGM